MSVENNVLNDNCMNKVVGFCLHLEWGISLFMCVCVCEHAPGTYRCQMPLQHKILDDIAWYHLSIWWRWAQHNCEITCTNAGRSDLVEDTQTDRLLITVCTHMHKHTEIIQHPWLRTHTHTIQKKGKWISQFLLAYTVRPVTSFFVQSHILTTEWKHFQGFVFAAYLKCNFSLTIRHQSQCGGLLFSKPNPKIVSHLQKLAAGRVKVWT